MSDGTRDERTWEDSAGTEWRVRRRQKSVGARAGWVLTCVDYTFVAFEASPDAPTTDRLQTWVDRHGADAERWDETARLWTDPRSRTEWEVDLDAGELVFRSGTEVFRAPRGDGGPSPRTMDEAELQEALDRAQSGG